MKGFLSSTRLQTQQPTEWKNDKNIADRFIPLRSNLELSHYILKTNNELSFDEEFKDATYVNLAADDFKRQNYRNGLWKTLFKKPLNKINCFGHESDEENHQIVFPDWPVYKRKERITSGPLMLLDMPGLTFNLKNNCVDWGASNVVVTCALGSLYICHPTRFDSFRYETTYRFNNCLKFDRTGKLLAIGLEKEGFIILNMEKEEIPVVSVHKRCCESSLCFITSFSWKRNGMLFTSCTKGNIVKYVNFKKFLSWRKTMCCYITKLDLSCNDNYLACIDPRGHSNVWKINYKSCNINEFNFCYGVRETAWHPRCESIIVLATVNCQIETFNVSSQQRLNSILLDKVGIVDALTFNPLSAELVVSYFCISSGNSIIYIMASLSNIVDAIKWHPGRVQYLKWNPDGTELATTGSDENMAIWSFFGSKKNEYIKMEKSKAKAFQHLFFKNTIR